MSLHDTPLHCILHHPSGSQVVTVIVNAVYPSYFQHIRHGL